MNNNKYIIDTLRLILAMYQTMRAYFYQQIPQSQFTNNQLATYKINYTLLLPASKFQNNLNAAQVNAQLQEYINLCNVLIQFITSNVDLQTNLVYEQIQNELNSSIAQINGFSATLLQAKYAALFTYNVPYDMGFTTVLFLNQIDLLTYPLQASLNYNLQDFNNLLANTKIILTR